MASRSRRDLPRTRRARLEGALLVATVVALPNAVLTPLRARAFVARTAAPVHPTVASLYSLSSPGLLAGSGGLAQPSSQWQRILAQRATDVSTEEAVVVADANTTEAEVTAEQMKEALEEERLLKEKQLHEEVAQELEEWGSRNWLVSALAAVGVADTGYLTAVKLGTVPLACPSSAANSCDLVLGSQWASVGDVPLAVFGLIAYSAVFVLGLSKEWPRNGILYWLVFAMALASSALMLILLIFLHAPCAFCAASAITSALLLGVVETAKQRTEPRGSGSPRIAVVVLAAAVAGAAIRAGTLPPPDPSDFYNLIEVYKPEHPPLRSESDKARIALAKHLTSIGAVCYTAWWCPHCQDQREQFGRQAVEVGPFVQCAEVSRKQNEYCKEKDIESYPSWVINGEKLKGGKKLAKLVELSGFKEYPAEYFIEKPDTVTDYIWKVDDATE